MLILKVGDLVLKASTVIRAAIEKLIHLLEKGDNQNQYVAFRIIMQLYLEKRMSIKVSYICCILPELCLIK